MKALADSLEREAPEPTPERERAIGAVLRQWFWDDWARLTKTEREARFQGATADLLALLAPAQGCVAPERERAIERVMAMDVPGSGPLELVRREAEAIVDALLALPDPVRDEMERLRKIEEAARYVRGNWDREATQHASMPALREALDGHPGAPTRAEVLAASIVQENARLHAVRDAAREVVEASKRAPSFMPPGLLLAMSRLRAALDESEHA